MSDVKVAVKLEPGEWIVEGEFGGEYHITPCDPPHGGVCNWKAYVSDGAYLHFYDDGTSFFGEHRVVRRADQPSARIAALEAHNAALQTELDSLRAIMDSEHETFLQELILTAYGNAPFGTDHAKVVADAKALLRTMEGGAV